MKSANTAINYDRLVEDILEPEDIHAASTVTEATAVGGLFLVFAIVLTLVEAVLLYMLLRTDIWPVVPLFLHLLACSIAGVLTYAQYKKGFDVQHLALMVIVTSVTGIFGTLGALLGFVAAAIFRSRAQVFAEWYESIFPTDSYTPPQTIYDRIVEGLDENPSNYDVMPFADVMKLGAQNQKRRALAKMTSRFSPRFAPAFRIALGDANNTIRVQAATAIAKIEREYGAKRERIEQARLKEPKNHFLTLALAKFYDDYAFTGVLDPELETLNRERAIATYKTYLQQDPNSSEAWMAVGRLMFRNRQWEDAAEWFRQALDRGWKSETMVLWYFESLFRLGLFRELRRSMLEYGRSIINKDELPADVRHAVSMWMQVA